MLHCKKRIVECSFKIDTDFISRDSACLLVQLNLIFQISSIINIIFWQPFHRSGEICHQRHCVSLKQYFPTGRVACDQIVFWTSSFQSACSLLAEAKWPQKNRPILLGDMVCVCVQMYTCLLGLCERFVKLMMMIAFITFNSTCVPLIEGLWSSNPWKFEFAGFRRNRTDDLQINSPLLWPFTDCCFYYVKQYFSILAGGSM